VSPSPPVTAGRLREAFDAGAHLTVGIEEEVMLLDPETLDLAPRAEAVIDRLGGDPAFKLELPASQIEIVTPPRADVPAAARHLAGGRRRLAEAAAPLARPAAAGVHPFAELEGLLNPGERYHRLVDEYGPVARRQLVCAIQVHVAVAGADATLAVYNALRGYLPELAALAAAAPFYAGRDSGLASVRPLISQLLPRQGVPPAIPSWEAFAAELAWGAAAGGVPEPRRWWWELRPNPAYGTLEIRVPDAQARVADTAAVAAVAHALVGRLAERHAAGEELPAPPSWRIAENGWSAARHGVEGELADLSTGHRVATRERLHALLDELEPTAARLGCAAPLADARRLVAENGAILQRRAGAEAGSRAVAAWLAERFDDAGAPEQPVERVEATGAGRTPA
jgi:glutamate---cysteine ligase / carboxylate-amine ligase